MQKLRVHAQAVRGSFDTSRDCLHDLCWFVNCYLVHRTEAICFAGLMTSFVLTVQQWTCETSCALLILGLRISSWCFGCLRIFSQCFSVFRSLNDETQNWHSHRAHLVLGIVLHSGALYFLRYSTPVYLDYFTYYRVKRFLCFTYHTRGTKLNGETHWWFGQCFKRSCLRI